ncbi:hypothetical protein Sjap_026541 [Stephania japonica]|uniref:Uncharacterized protein n=1 Tax=Stephania japonica TaxID=461633 RepID=A0AAP0HKJ4_9MAGN
MIWSLNSSGASAMVVVLPSKIKRKTSTVPFMSLNVNTTTEQLRSQLHKLNVEADQTRTKARSARLRLMRLSEAAEKLQQRAANDVQLGKENDARELLVQKKKVMHALEKSKRRVELLDELLAKLNEAISMKERYLIGTVARGLEVGEEDASSSGTVHVILPKKDISNLNENSDNESEAAEPIENHELQYPGNSEAANLPNQFQEHDITERAASMGVWKGDESVGKSNGISSFEHFLEHVDQQLDKIEIELLQVLSISTLMLENEERPKNSKMQQMREILEDVRGIRGRIASTMTTKAEVK